MPIAGLDSDVIVVGGGLAGLQCARDLQGCGLVVAVLEAGDRIGGRVQTEEIDGFTVDVGFQVLNSAYPAVRRLIDIDALDLQQFEAGVGVRDRDRLKILADPIRAPKHLIATLRSGYLNPAAIAALLRWAVPALVPPSRTKRARGDGTLKASFELAGFNQPLRHEVIETFLAGVLVDSSASSSAAFTQLLVRSFILSSPGLPAAGMNALPRQIAAGLNDVRVQRSVHAVGDDDASATVRTPDGELRARAVVIAAGPREAADLTGIPPPPMKGLTTWWFAAEVPPSTLALLLIDAAVGRGGTGPVINTCVVSNAAPTYAPRGQHLIQATCLHDRPGADSEPDVRRHLAEIYGVSTERWTVIAHHRIPHALPTQPPPLSLSRPAQLRDRVFVCGDHRDTASLQGALASGQRVARAVRRRLSSGR